LTFRKYVKLRWIPDGDKADWGVAIGRFYSFAPHHCAWTWCYLIWLDKLSPSYPWTVDTAWEDDLEPLEDAAMMQKNICESYADCCPVQGLRSRLTQRWNGRIHPMRGNRVHFRGW
jgi:hypothetical protein